ncbi:MAG: ABC transporter ATP-binding protein [Promethearchaeia archaeon]
MIENLPNNQHVSVRGLKKYFDDVKAVDDISFDIHPGEVFGLLGPNGAGKTTTIKLLLGLLEPLDGYVNVLGYEPQRNDVKIKENVGYVAEESLIFKSLTPRDLFNFIGSIRNLDEEEAQERVEEYLESLDAKEYYDKIIETLSQGNKQKMQIIAAIIHSPDLLILDEPLAGLDAKSARVVKEIIDLHTGEGGSVLFSTHIMEVAEDMCHRIAILNRGKIVAVGTMEELRKKANKLGASLEDVFLKLTEQDESINNIIQKLRKSSSQKRG